MVTENDFIKVDKSLKKIISKTKWILVIYNLISSSL